MVEIRSFRAPAYFQRSLYGCWTYGTKKWTICLLSRPAWLKSMKLFLLVHQGGLLCFVFLGSFSSKPTEMIDIWFPNLRGADLTWGFIRRRLNEVFGTLQRRGLSGFTTEHHESRLTFWLVHVQHSRETLGGMYIEAFLIFGVNVSGTSVVYV